MGFTFDDRNPDATSLAEMERLIAQDPRNQERIFPYIGGEEVNSSPTHSHHRYVINFGEMSEAEARQWPDLMAIVEEKVKPARFKQNREIRKRYWWRFGETTPALFKVIAECDRVLVISRIGQHGSFTFLNSDFVFSESLVIFPLPNHKYFALLQSSIHEIWARFLGSSLEERLRYTPSDCFETFPFPENHDTNPDLEAIGEHYYHYRADLMVKNNQGLTDTYNRFHDPNETHPDILQLRQLHQQLDTATLTAYGWHDLTAADYGFALDYLDLDDDLIDQLPPNLRQKIDSHDLFFPDPHTAATFDATIKTLSKTRKKLPWRYRWPDPIRNDILARLLDLNQERYDAEIRLGLHVKKSKTRKQPATGQTEIHLN